MSLSPSFNTVAEVKEIIHGTKAFDSLIKLKNILMTSPNYINVVKVKKNIHDTIIMFSWQPMSKQTMHDSLM